MPSAGYSAVGWRGRVVVFGGSAHDDAAVRFTNAVWVLNAADGALVHQPCTGEAPAPQAHHTACVYENEMWVVQGLGEESASEEWLHTAVLDLTTWRWRQVAHPGQRVPAYRFHHASCINDGVLYTYGGYAVRQDDYAVRSELFCLNLQTGRYSVLEIPQFQPVWGHSMTSLNGMLLIFGGVEKNKDVNTILAYDIAGRKAKKLCSNKPGVWSRVDVVQASHDFSPQDPRQIPLTKGDIVHVLQGEGVQDAMPGWYKGFIGEDAAKAGWFPKKCVKRVVAGKLVSKPALPRQETLTEREKGTRLQMLETGEVLQVVGKEAGGYRYEYLLPEKYSAAERAYTPCETIAPGARSLHAAVRTETGLFIAGGEQADVQMADAWALDLIHTNKWTRTAPSCDDVSAAPAVQLSPTEVALVRLPESVLFPDLAQAPAHPARLVVYNLQDDVWSTLEVVPPRRGSTVGMAPARPRKESTVSKASTTVSATAIRSEAEALSRSRSRTNTHASASAALQVQGASHQYQLDRVFMSPLPSSSSAGHVASFPSEPYAPTPERFDSRCSKALSPPRSPVHYANAGASPSIPERFPLDEALAPSPYSDAVQIGDDVRKAAAVRGITSPRAPGVAPSSPSAAQSQAQVDNVFESQPKRTLTPLSELQQCDVPPCSFANPTPAPALSSNASSAYPKSEDSRQFTETPTGARGNSTAAKPSGPAAPASATHRTGSPARKPPSASGHTGGPGGRTVSLPPSTAATTSVVNMPVGLPASLYSDHTPAIQFPSAKMTIPEPYASMPFVRDMHAVMPLPAPLPASPSSVAIRSLLGARHRSLDSPPPRPSPYADPAAAACAFAAAYPSPMSAEQALMRRMRELEARVVSSEVALATPPLEDGVQAQQQRLLEKRVGELEQKIAKEPHGSDADVHQSAQGTESTAAAPLASQHSWAPDNAVQQYTPTTGAVVSAPHIGAAATPQGQAAPSPWNEHLPATGTPPTTTLVADPGASCASTSAGTAATSQLTAVPLLDQLAPQRQQSILTHRSVASQRQQSAVSHHSVVSQARSEQAAVASQPSGVTSPPAPAAPASSAAAPGPLAGHSWASEELQPVASLTGPGALLAHPLPSAASATQATQFIGGERRGPPHSIASASTLAGDAVPEEVPVHPTQSLSEEEVPVVPASEPVLVGRSRSLTPPTASTASMAAAAPAPQGRLGLKDASTAVDDIPHKDRATSVMSEEFFSSLRQSPPPRRYEEPQAADAAGTQQDELVVLKQRGEKLGMIWRGPVLVAVEQDGAAWLCGGEMFVGRTVTHVSGVPFASLKSIVTATTDMQMVRLGFRGQMTDTELADHVLRTYASESLTSPPAKRKMAKTASKRSRSLGVKAPKGSAGPRTPRLETPPRRSTSRQKRELSPSHLSGFHTNASMRKRRSFSSDDPTSYYMIRQGLVRASSIPRQQPQPTSRLFRSPTVAKTPTGTTGTPKKKKTPKQPKREKLVMS